MRVTNYHKNNLGEGNPSKPRGNHDNKKPFHITKENFYTKYFSFSSGLVKDQSIMMNENKLLELV